MNTENKYYGPGIAVIKTKQGREYVGPIRTWRPEDNFVSISEGMSIVEISFDGIESAYEYDRAHINSPPEGERIDLMERARKELKQGRELGWWEKNIPLMKWEKN